MSDIIFIGKKILSKTDRLKVPFKYKLYNWLVEKDKRFNTIPFIHNFFVNLNINDYYTINHYYLESEIMRKWRITVNQSYNDATGYYSTNIKISKYNLVGIDICSISLKYKINLFGFYKNMTVTDSFADIQLFHKDEFINYLQNGIIKNVKNAG